MSSNLLKVCILFRPSEVLEGSEPDSQPDRYQKVKKALAVKQNTRLANTRRVSDIMESVNSFESEIAEVRPPSPVSI